METATSPGVRPIPKAAAMLSPVPTATGVSAIRPSSPAAAPVSVPACSQGPRTIRDGTGPFPLGVDEPQQVEPVPALGGRPVTGARGVAPIRHGPTGEPEVQPIVGQHHPGHAGECTGLAPTEPRQFGHGEGSHRHAPGGLRPTLGGQEIEQPQCVGCRLGVVPELGRAQHPVVPIEDHQAVLLSGHGQPLHVGWPGLLLRCFSQRGGHGLHQRRPPPLRCLLAPWRRGGRVFGSSGPDHPSGGHVTQLDLGRLRGGVDPGYERHRSDASGHGWPAN